MDGVDPADETLRAVLAAVLGLSPTRAAALTVSNPLFGAIPELDSLAVAGILTELEERLDVRINEDDLSVDNFETYGSLLEFVRRQMGS